MTFWIQHGYGKAEKIETVSDKGLLTGVVLSPADEEPATLRLTATMIGQRKHQLLLDPQLYIHTISGAIGRCHDSHKLDFDSISWLVPPEDIGRQVQIIIDLNDELGIEHIIAPAPYQVSFNDVWSLLSLQYARATIDATDKPVYASLIAEETAFADWDQTLQYLDALTTLDVDGIYLIVGTSSRSYPFVWDAQRLTNVLRVIYTLSELNQYKIMWAYSDIAGLLGLMAGASAATTGWYYSLRYWSTAKWIPQGGGRQPNPRIFVEPILSVLTRDDEAYNIAQTHHSTRVFPDSTDRNGIRHGTPWGISDSWDQHLVSIAQLYQTLDLSLNVSERIEFVMTQLHDALDLITDIEASGVAIDVAHKGRLEAFVKAIDTFADIEGL